jgi:hypothetical protein
VRRHVRVGPAKVEHLDRHPQRGRQDQDAEQPEDQLRARVHARGLVQEQREQQEARHLETDKREGHQHEPDDQLAASPSRRPVPLLDEPFEGLAPAVSETIFRASTACAGRYPS